LIVVGPAIATLTRADLRWRIANRLGGSEEWAWQAQAGGATTTTFAELPDLVIGGVNDQRGMWAYFPDGALNKGLERRVVSFRPWEPADPYADPPLAETPPAIEWAPSLPEPVALGERIDLCVLRPRRINDAIDDALRLMQEMVALPAEATLAVDGVSDRYLLPADAVAVADVTLLEAGWTADTGDPVPLPLSAWSLEPGRRLKVGGYAAWGPFGWRPGVLPAGVQLVIDYRAAVALPADDDALVACLPDAVVDTAVSSLALGMSEFRPMLPLFLDQAQRSRARAGRHDFGSVRPVMP
jgi:hypothetical protein